MRFFLCSFSKNAAASPTSFCEMIFMIKGVSVHAEIQFTYNSSITACNDRRTKPGMY